MRESEGNPARGTCDPHTHGVKVVTQTLVSKVREEQQCSIPCSIAQDAQHKKIKFFSNNNTRLVVGVANGGVSITN